MPVMTPHPETAPNPQHVDPKLCADLRAFVDSHPYFYKPAVAELAQLLTQLGY